MLCIFENGSFFLFACLKPEGIFLWYLFWVSAKAPRGKSCGNLPKSIHLEFLIVKIVLARPPAACQVHVRFSFCCPGSHIQEALTSGLCLSLSNLGGPGWLVSPLFYGSKKSCWHFHLCSLWLVRMGSGNFHTPSMQNQRLEAFSLHRIPSWLSRAVSDFRVQQTPHMEKPERRTLLSCLLLYLEPHLQYSNVFPFCLSVPMRLANTLLFSRLLGTISHFECDLYPTFRWEKKINCKMFSHISKSFAFLGNFFP